MFHFKRRTLWIIIYLTIPLIIILNNIVPNATQTEENSIAAQDLWSLDQVDMSCDQLICHQNLPNSNRFLISAILTQLPVNNVIVPDALHLKMSRQGGFVVATVELQATKANIKRFVEFVKDWVPKNEPTRWIITGEDTQALAERLPPSVTFTAAGMANKLPPPSGLTVLESPSFGSEQQLAFLLWMEILEQRLSGYGIEVAWDHRRQKSHVLVNSTLSDDAFEPISEAELTAILQIYLASADQRLRTENQLHRYAVTSLIYDMPYEFFINQPERLRQVTLEAVNQMRENAFDQVKQKRE